MGQAHSGLGAAAETLGALLACLLGGGLLKNALHAGAQAALPPALHASAAGLGHCAGCALTFVALYSARLRPAAAAAAAAQPPLLLAAQRSTLAALARTAVRGCGGPAGAPRLLSTPGALLLAFHGASLVGLGAELAPLARRDPAGAWAQLTACATSTALLWAPLFEELLFRGALFYLALHRSGGDVRLAAALCAGAFAAMHAPNVLGAGADWGYVGLQVVAAAVCGGAWTCVFAARGSLAEVALLHAANNAAAVVWLARGGGSGGGSSATAACSLAPPPPEQRGVALASLALQTAVYAAGGALAWHDLQRATAEDGGRAFKALHPVVYPQEGEEEAAAAAAAVKRKEQ
jgi:membrane protease YdiL (CAAX protease family)